MLGAAAVRDRSSTSEDLVRTLAVLAIVAPGKTAAAKIKALAAAHKHLVVDLIRPRLTNEGSQTIALEGANQASQAVYLSIIASDTDPKSLIAGFQKATL